MKLSTRSRYGLRILLEIAKNYGKKVTSVKEICESQKISKKYAEQILIRLKKVGLIRGERGVKGGYILNEEPSNITLDIIIDLMENNFKLVNCERCDLSYKCKTKNIWGDAESLLRNYFSKIKLSDLI